MLKNYKLNYIPKNDKWFIYDLKNNKRIEIPETLQTEANNISNLYEQEKFLKSFSIRTLIGNKKKGVNNNVI